MINIQSIFSLKILVYVQFLKKSHLNLYRYDGSIAAASRAMAAADQLSWQLGRKNL